MGVMPAARTIRLTLFVALTLLLIAVGGLQWLRTGEHFGEASYGGPRATRPVSQSEPGYTFSASRDPLDILRQDLQTADFDVLIDLITTTIRPSSGWEELENHPADESPPAALADLFGP